MRFLVTEVPLYPLAHRGTLRRAEIRTTPFQGGHDSLTQGWFSSQLILSECTYEAYVNQLWTPYNRTSVCALRAQIPTGSAPASKHEVRKAPGTAKFQVWR